MLAFVSDLRVIHLGWFWFIVELLSLLSASGHEPYLCYPHCTCRNESISCRWLNDLSLNLRNDTKTIFIHGMKNITCNILTAEHPIDIHFVNSDIDFIPSCIFGNVTIVNLLFSESKVRIIRCMEFFYKSIETVIFHKSEISSIQPYAFAGSKIENLLITQSIISRIEQNAFSRSSMKTIAFVENTIYHISSGLFSMEQQNILSTFILYQCNIFYIGCQEFFPTSFTLNKNKMTCDAQLHWLLQRLHGSNDLTDNTCRRPQMMIGRTLAELDLNELCRPPSTCAPCSTVKMEHRKIKCLHISGDPEHHLSKKSPNSNRNESSELRKKMDGLKQKLNFIIFNRRKTGRQTQNNQTSTVAPSKNSSTPDITAIGDLYSNFNFDSVPQENSTSINHIVPKGEVRELKLDRKAKLSIQNHTLNLISDVKQTQHPQKSEKNHSNMFTSKKFKTKYTTIAKIKSSGYNDVSASHNVSKKQPSKEPLTPPEDQLLKNISMDANREQKVEFFESNNTGNNVTHVKKELHPGRWQKSPLNVYHPLSLSILKNALHSQNHMDSIQALHDLWKREEENIGKEQQRNNKEGQGLLIQTMTTLKKVYQVMPFDIRKREREKIQVVVKKVHWAWHIVPGNEMKKNEMDSKQNKKLKF